MNIIGLVHDGNFKRVVVHSKQGKFGLDLYFNSVPQLLLSCRESSNKTKISYHLKGEKIKEYETAHSIDALAEHLYYEVVDMAYLVKATIARKTATIQQVMETTAHVLSLYATYTNNYYIEGDSRTYLVKAGLQKDDPIATIKLQVVDNKLQYVCGDVTTSNRNMVVNALAGLIQYAENTKR